jgi:hypothetical protein
MAFSFCKGFDVEEFRETLPNSLVSILAYLGNNAMEVNPKNGEILKIFRNSCNSFSDKLRGDQKYQE